MARGAGPLLWFGGAVLIFSERPSLLVVASVLRIVLGVFLIAGGPATLRGHSDQSGLLWGVTIGTAISAYTLVNGDAVQALLVAPVLVDDTGNLIRAMCLTPRARADRARATVKWQRDGKPAIGVGVRGPSADILVL